MNIKTRLYNFLRYSERYLKTDMIYLARGGFWLTIGQVFSTISIFLLSIAFANLIPVETYGVYKYVLSIASVLAIASLSGIDTAIFRSISRGKEGSLYTGLKTKLKWSTFGSLVAFAGAIYYFTNENITLSLAMLIVGIFLPLANSFSLYASVLNGKRDFSRLGNSMIFINTISSLSVITTLFITDNVLILLTVYFTSLTLTSILLFLYVTRIYTLNDQVDDESISYGKHLSMIKGVSIATGSVGSILLFQFLGAKSLALFAFAVAPAEQIRSLIKITEKIFFPKISAVGWKLSLNQFIKKITPFLIVITFISFFYILVAPFLFKVLFPQYLDAVLYSQIYSLTLPLTATTIILTAILKAQKRTKDQYKLVAIDVVVLILITVPAIYFFGIWGIISSIFISKITYIVIISYLFFNKSNDPE